MKLISIIIPCHNEEGNIDLLYKELESNLSNLNYDFEYVLINDGSKDKTVEVIKKYTVKDIKVKLIDFSRNFGKEKAMLAGLDYCKGDAAIIIDADLQMPIRYICDLIKEWENGYKLVLTHRHIREKGFKNKLASKYYDVYNKIADSKIIKDAMDFQLMDREVINVMCSIRERNRFFKGLTGYIGYNYTTVPVELEERKEGKSSFGTFETLFSYAFKSFVIHSDVPIRYAIKIGVMVSLLSFLYLAYIVITTLIYGNKVDGYASLMSVMLFMFGVVLLFLGIIGYYLSLMYDEVKQRPNYIVEETINID